MGGLLPETMPINVLRYIVKQTNFVSIHIIHIGV